MVMRSSISWCRGLSFFQPGGWLFGKQHCNVGQGNSSLRRSFFECQGCRWWTIAWLVITAACSRVARRAVARRILCWGT
ncbi:hypothetical protein KC19_2G139400 [Ceratodon purpureus]|uniref:Uncharacterized protein n=1 Tax=Ceratodon purpureus TaxID=3225 RepID=A0A8T0IW65_CERPU|nr:hypothetical protein KC19_2G139400 [Ceratodon purpureus]